MAWEKLTNGDPIVEYNNNKGTFQWNGVTHQMLDNPQAIELFYDAEMGRIGILKAFWNSALRVAASEEYPFSVHVLPYLTKAGLEFVDSWSAEPQGPVTEEPEPGELDVRGLVWVDIP